MIIIAAMIVSHGIPLPRFFAGGCRVSAYPLLVAIAHAHARQRFFLP
jgi:hypothetical protein